MAAVPETTVSTMNDYQARQAARLAASLATIEANRARLAAIPDAELVRRLTSCRRAYWEASQAGSHVLPSCDTELESEYQRRTQVQQIATIPMPTDVPAYQNFLTQRQIDDTAPTGIFGWAIGPFYTAFSTLRTGVYRSETATTFEKAKSLGLLALPPAIGYVVYKKTHGNLGWSALLGLGAIAALPILGAVLFYGTMAIGGGFRQ